MRLIYCAGKNPRFDEIAHTAGYLLGARLPATVYYPVYFADQDWEEPNRAAYMAALAEHRPQVASVLDWERPEQFCEVMDWAEEAAKYSGSVVIIPKVVGGVRRIPHFIGNKPVILGYSVQTNHGATKCDLSEFAGRDVHLLGGNPHEQMRIWDELNAPLRLSLWEKPPRIVSADGNMANRQATMFCKFWERGRWMPIDPPQADAPYEAFRRSCVNIREAWEKRVRLSH